MKQWIKDTAGLGIAFWLMGYLASLVLFFTPYAGIMGWILAGIFTPVALVVTWWWFRSREYLPVQYYAGVGVVWVLIAIVFDFLFIVTLFQAAAYYKPDVVVYYIVTFLVPVAVGLYLNRSPANRCQKRDNRGSKGCSGTPNPFVFEIFRSLRQVDDLICP